VIREDFKPRARSLLQLLLLLLVVAGTTTVMDTVVIVCGTVYGTMTTCPSVCPIYRPLQAGVQQQMRAVSRCQLTEEAERTIIASSSNSGTSYYLSFKYAQNLTEAFALYYTERNPNRGKNKLWKECKQISVGSDITRRLLNKTESVFDRINSKVCFCRVLFISLTAARNKAQLCGSCPLYK